MKQQNKTILEFLLILNFFLIIFLFGLFLNNIVMINNGGRMPVYAIHRPVQETEIHYGYSDKNEINLWYLSDVFFAEKDMFIHPKGSIFSIGDCFLWIGYFGSWLTLLFFTFYVTKLILWKLK